MFVKFLKITIALCSFFILMNAMPLYAAGLNFKPQVGIGGEFTKGANVAVSNSTQTIGEYIKQIYKYAIGIVGIVAVVVMMIGGVLWMTAGGNPSQVGSAQQYITGALTGLVLVMFSYVILKTVNPDLVSFKVHEIKKIELAGNICCENTGGNGCRMTTSDEECTNYGTGEWKVMGNSYVCGETKCINNSSGCCVEYYTSETEGHCSVGYTADCCPAFAFTYINSDTRQCMSKSSSTDLMTYFFKDTACESIDKCPKKSDICNEKAQGAECTSGGKNGRCDKDGACITTEGTINDWCGYEGCIGKCNQTCGAVSPYHILRGRSCNGSGIYCCSASLSCSE